MAYGYEQSEKDYEADRRRRKFEESKHKREASGRFVAKPKASLSGKGKGKKKPKEDPKVRAARIAANKRRAEASRKRAAANRLLEDERQRRLAAAERRSAARQKVMLSLFPKIEAQRRAAAEKASSEFVKRLVSGEDFDQVNALMMPGYTARKQRTEGRQRNLMHRIQTERQRLAERRRTIRAEIQARKVG